MSGKDAPAASSTVDDDEVLKVATPHVTSSPKHQQQEATHTDDDLEQEIHVDDDDLENIDEIIASHQTSSVKSTPTRSTRSTAPVTRGTGNLLSSFSVSNVV